jgi:hypothetical protein
MREYDGRIKDKESIIKRERVFLSVFDIDFHLVAASVPLENSLFLDCHYSEKAEKVSSLLHLAYA